MARAYSMDLRSRVLDDAAAGVPSKDLAAHYHVSLAWVNALKQRQRETGDPSPRKQTRWRTPLLHGQTGQLQALIDEQPDRTLAELKALLATEASVPTICRAVRKLGYRIKKTVRAAEQDRPDVAAARTAWRAEAPTWEASRLVFLDESGVRTDLIRRYGRGRRGVRVTDTAPDGRWHTTTFLAGLRMEGLIAPGVFDGPIDTASFTAWVEQQLAPSLRPGDVVILDNLSCHHSPAAQHAVEAVGARFCFLPKYSPDLNPIELCFAKLKAILRAARCRTVATMWETIGQCIPRFSATECQQYFRHCGYSVAAVRS